MANRLITYLRSLRLETIEANKKLDALSDELKRQNKMQYEILFANLFRDSIQDSTWLKSKGFSAYGAAANYSLLYKLFKIYDIFQPISVLELGLGQSTKILAQYAQANPRSKALVIDDDLNWIDIYKKQTTIPKNMQIKEVGLQDFKYKGKVLQKKSEYKDLGIIIKNTKFNLIIVDGPIGWDKEYPRTNVIGLIDNLSEDWIVVFDDADREGEQRTIHMFVEELNKKHISYADFVVMAGKSQHYFCASNLQKVISNI